MQITEIRETWTALYARLSLDDGNVGESMSIQSQKAILTRKAEELGIYNYRFYVDDGYSGTNFNRPSFQQMIADIEAGKVTCVITKDLSRLGRNYLESGAYIEVFFPKHQVRYIAVNDGVDSANSGEMDITPFKNILNEFYSRDVSKKVKSGKYIRASQGKFMGTHAPFGYQKDPEDKNHLIADEETAPTVRYIFQLALQGMGNNKIGKILYEQKIPKPAYYKPEYFGKFLVKEDDAYSWKSAEAKEPPAPEAQSHSPPESEDRTPQEPFSSSHRSIRHSCSYKRSPLFPHRDSHNRLPTGRPTLCLSPFPPQWADPPPGLRKSLPPLCPGKRSSAPQPPSVILDSR